MAGRARALEYAPALLALVFAVPVAIGLAGGLLDAFGVRHPTIGDTASIDGQAVYLGNVVPFTDPNEGYQATGYTPLFPMVVGLLDVLYLWRGWTIVLGLLSSVALLATAAWLAYRPLVARGGPRWAAIAEAVGVGALVWWTMFAGWQTFLIDDRPDQVCWALGLVGLVLVPKAIGGSRAAWIASIALLSGAFWAKQTAVIPAVAATAWLAAAAFGGWTTWRTALRYALTLLAVNLVVLAVLAAASGGWAYRTTIAASGTTLCCELQSDQILRHWFYETLSSTVFTVAFCGLVWLGVALATGVRPVRWRPRGAPAAVRGWLGRLSPEGRIALILLVFLVIDTVVAIRARQNVGSARNQSLGVAWAIALLGALGYGMARARARASPLAVAAVAGVLLAVPLVGAGSTYKVAEFEMTMPGLVPSWDIPEIPGELVALGRERKVYHPDWSDLSVASKRSLYPNWINMTGRLAQGKEHRYLVDALLNREFDVVFPFEDRRVTHPLSTGGGLYEENYLWKLNEVMREKYPEPVQGGTAYARAEGPDPAPWMRACFGPYVLGGVEYRQHHGGGFWCPRGDTIALRRTPPGVVTTDLRTVEAVEKVSGLLRVALRAEAAGFEIAVVSRRGTLWWHLRGELADGTLKLTAAPSHDEPVELAATEAGVRIEEAPRSRWGLSRAGDGEVVWRTPEVPDGGQLLLATSAESNAVFDLSRLTVEEAA
jgi:hypothetical protein